MKKYLMCEEPAKRTYCNFHLAVIKKTGLSITKSKQYPHSEKETCRTVYGRGKRQ